MKTLKELEKDHILYAMALLKNKTKVASALGISVKTLYNKLHEYDAMGIVLDLGELSTIQTKNHAAQGIK